MRKQLLSTPLFSVEHREYRQAGSRMLARDVVVHPGAVVILPITCNGDIVMIRNYRYTIEEELCELPAGTREAGEEPLDTAARELAEETGYQAKSLKPLLQFYPSPGVLTERMHAFVATELTHVGQNLANGEEITVEIIPRSIVRKKLVDGEFHDGKTIATLATYFLQT